NGAPDLDPGPDVYDPPYYMPPHHSTSMFVSKLSYEGDLIWSKAFMGDSLEYLGGPRPTCQFTDQDGAVYVGGMFKGGMNFDPGGSVNVNATNMDIFVLKLDSGGQFIWLNHPESPSPQIYLDDWPWGIEVDRFKNVYTAGFFESMVVDFDPGPDTFLMYNHGDYDGFVQKLRQCPGTIDTVYATVCYSYHLGSRT